MKMMLLAYLGGALTLLSQATLADNMLVTECKKSFFGGDPIALRKDNNVFLSVSGQALRFRYDATGLTLLDWVIKGDKRNSVSLLQRAQNQPLWNFSWQKKTASSFLILRKNIKTKVNAKAGTASLLARFVYSDGLTLNVNVTAYTVPREVRWRISINHTGRKIQLATVSFPVINDICVDQQENMGVALPRIHGKYYQGISNISSYHADYPFAYANMQFLALTGRKHGLFIGALDPKANRKHFSLRPNSDGNGVNYKLKHLPTYGTDYQSGGSEKFHTDYDIVTRITGGTWLEAAKIYRKWALKQFWTSKGKMIDRSDIPQSFKDITYWHYSGCWEGDHFDEFIPGTIQLQKKLKRPTYYWWAGWHNIPFDDCYPEYLPPKKGFAKWCKKLIKAGISPVPYVNIVYWDMTTDSWKKQNAYKLACMTPEKNIFWGRFANGHNNAKMCPWTPGWRKKIVDVCEYLAKEHKAGGIYLDCLGTGPEVPCFNSNHGHPLGYGVYSSEGRRKLLKEIRLACRKYNPDFIIVGEGNPEDLIGECEGGLATQQDSNTIPLYEAVYSDYTTLYGEDNRASFWATQRELPLVHGLARNLLWGNQIGRSKGFRITQCGKENIVKYINQLCNVRTKWTRFLRDGEYIGNGLAKKPLPHSVVYTGDRSEYKGQIYPVIEAAAWKADNGDRAVFIVNCTPEAREAFIKSPKKLSGLPEAATVECYSSKAKLWRMSAKSGKLPKAILVPGYAVRIVYYKSKKDEKTILNQINQKSISDFQISTTWANKKFLSNKTPAVKVHISNYTNYRGPALIKITAKLHRRGSFKDWDQVRTWRWKQKVNLTGKSTQTAIIKGASGKMPWSRIPAGDARISAELFTENNFKKPVAISTAGMVLGGHEQLSMVGFDMQKTVKIDGKLDDWKNTKWYSLKNRASVFRRDWKGKDDLSAEIAVQWDKKYIYIAVKGKDNKHFNSLSDAFKGDSLQFAIFAEKNNIPLSSIIHLGVSLKQNGTTQVYQWAPARGESMPGFNAAAKRDGNNTIYELSLERAKVFNSKASLLNNYKFSWALLDMDSANERLGWIEWAGGLCFGYDKKRFGNLFLKLRSF